MVGAAAKVGDWFQAVAGDVTRAFTPAESASAKSADAKSTGAKSGTGAAAKVIPYAELKAITEPIPHYCESCLPSRSCDNWEVRTTTAIWYLWCNKCNKNRTKPPQIGTARAAVRCATCVHVCVIGCSGPPVGTSRPVLKPRQHDCKRCDGTGVFVAPTYAPCPACAGTGGLASPNFASGFREQCLMCEGEKALKNAYYHTFECPFCD